MKFGILCGMLVAGKFPTQLCEIYSHVDERGIYHKTGERLFVVLPQHMTGPIEAGTRVELETEGGRWYVVRAGGGIPGQRADPPIIPPQPEGPMQ
mgnify:CR=1 FL=1